MMCKWSVIYSSVYDSIYFSVTFYVRKMGSTMTGLVFRRFRVHSGDVMVETKVYPKCLRM